MNAIFASTTLIILFISGYKIVDSIPSIKFRKKYYDNIHLIIECIVYGSVLYLYVMVVGIFCPLAKLLFQESAIFLGELQIPILSEHSIMQNKHTVIISLSLMLSICIEILFKFLLPKNKKWLKIEKQHQRNSIMLNGGPLEKIIVDNYSLKPVMITLKNRKVYVGTIVGIPSSNNVHRRSLKLYPIKSGWQDPVTLSYTEEIDYAISGKIILYIIQNKIKWDQDFEFQESGKKNILKLNSKDIITSLQEGIVIDYEEIMSIRAWDKELGANFLKYKGKKKK